MALKILFLSKDIPLPLHSGGKIRTYNILVQLNKVFKVDIISLVCKDEHAYIPKMQKLCENFIYLKGKKYCKTGILFYLRLLKNLFSPYPYTMMNDTDKNLKHKIFQIANDYNLLICDFVFPALNCIDVTIPKLLFQHNVEYEIFQRQVKNNRGLKKLIWFLQYIKMRRMERIIAGKFEYIVAVSKRDMNIHMQEFSVKNIDYVELGVNINEYKKLPVKKDNKSIIFTGTMNWLPNVDAVEFFHEDIFPMLKRFTFYAIGKNPVKSLYRLQSDRFIITGTVPDIKPYLFKGMVYVVPLRVGGGTRIKIFEAMAAQIPVVSTTIGAEGLPVTDGENILLRDDPVDFGRAILNLSKNNKLNKKISSNAFKLVKENYSWEQVSQKFINACKVTANLH